MTSMTSESGRNDQSEVVKFDDGYDRIVVGTIQLLPDGTCAVIDRWEDRSQHQWLGGALLAGSTTQLNSLAEGTRSGEG